MCLRSISSCPITADKDIITYKVFRYFGSDCYETPFMGFKLKFLDSDKKISLPKVSLGIRQIPCDYLVQEGYHSFSSLQIARTHIKVWTRLTCPNFVILKAIIPKGTNYMKGIIGDIVAEQMIIMRP